MRSADDKLGALRVVLDDYADREYKLGANDCVSMVAAYLTELGVEHSWSSHESTEYVSLDDRDVVRRLVKELGFHLPASTEPAIGDIAMLDNDGYTFALATGRGWAAMMAKDNLYCIPFTVPARHLWRV